MGRVDAVISCIVERKQQRVLRHEPVRQGSSRELGGALKSAQHVADGREFRQGFSVHHCCPPLELDVASRIVVLGQRAGSGVRPIENLSYVAKGTLAALYDTNCFKL